MFKRRDFVYREVSNDISVVGNTYNVVRNIEMATGEIINLQVKIDTEDDLTTGEIHQQSIRRAIAILTALVE